LIAIGVAYGIHLYSNLHMIQLENPEADRRTAVTDMIKEMWNPVLMAAITTAVGFISLLTSQVFPIKYFGAFSAFGVLVAFALSILVIPAGILLFGLPKVKQKSGGEAKVSKVEDFAHRSADFFIKHKKQTYLATAVVILLSILGITRVWIDSSFLEKFEKDSDIVLTDKFINENFGGTSTLNVILEGNQPDKFKEPDALKALVKMQDDVENTLPIVGGSFSIADFLKRMNKVMNADDEAYNIIPDDVHLRGTTRHFQPQIQDAIEARMREIIEGISRSMGVTVEFSYERRYPAVVNTQDETQAAIRAAKGVAGNEEVITNLPPVMGSEDFAFMLQEVPGAYIGLGAGEPRDKGMLHQSRYDFNDDLLPMGVNYWQRLVRDLLPVSD
ncbi:MAG: M20/M25/M40 family metallo-hydrolase, partial [SAR324 cluster bacterium]|nr:M20/M25/M40 family metallo-hydrolase [SAR324 cluster bacterium]